MLPTHHSPSYINTSGHRYQELELFHVTWHKFNFNFSFPEFLNVLTLFLLVNLKFLSCRAQNILLGTELPKFPEGNQVLWEWDSSSRSLVKESVGHLVPSALGEHGCNTGLDDMASVPFSEENVLPLQYFNRLQVTPRDKSLKNSKVQKNTPNMKFTPGVYMRKYICASKCVCMHSTEENGYEHDCMCMTVHGSVCRSESAAQWVNIDVLLAKQDVLKGVKERKEARMHWAERLRGWFLHTFPMSKYSKMVPASPCANVLVLRDAGEPEGFDTTRQKY